MKREYNDEVVDAELLAKIGTADANFGSDNEMVHSEIDKIILTLLVSMGLYESAKKMKSLMDGKFWYA